jgi:hypothetical protein
MSARQSYRTSMHQNPLDFLDSNDGAFSKWMHRFGEHDKLVLDIILRDCKKRLTSLYSFFASQCVYSRAIVLGPQVPSMVEYLVEVSQVMNSLCVKGSEDPAPKKASYRECRVLFPGLCYA